MNYELRITTSETNFVYDHSRINRKYGQTDSVFEFLFLAPNFEKRFLYDNFLLGWLAINVSS